MSSRPMTCGHHLLCIRQPIAHKHLLKFQAPATCRNVRLALLPRPAAQTPQSSVVHDQRSTSAVLQHLHRAPTTHVTSVERACPRDSPPQRPAAQETREPSSSAPSNPGNPCGEHRLASKISSPPDDSRQPCSGTLLLAIHLLDVQTPSTRSERRFKQCSSESTVGITVGGIGSSTFSSPSQNSSCAPTTRPSDVGSLSSTTPESKFTTPKITYLRRNVPRHPPVFLVGAVKLRRSDCAADRHLRRGATTP